MPRRQRATTEFTTIQLGTLAACIFGAVSVVFLFGIYVGRGMPEHHAGIDEQVARIPVSAPPNIIAVERGPIAAPTGGGAGGGTTAATEPVPAVAETLTQERREPPEASADTEVAAAAEAAQAPAVPSVPYTVQVLATRNKSEATTLAAGLKKQRIGAFVSEVEDTAGSWYRVRIGIYDDLESAQVMETRLRNLGLQQAYVSRYR